MLKLWEITQFRNAAPAAIYPTECIEGMVRSASQFRASASRLVFHEACSRERLRPKLNTFRDDFFVLPRSPLVFLLCSLLGAIFAQREDHCATNAMRKSLTEQVL